MKLVHPDLQLKMELHKNQLNFLVVERTEYFEVLASALLHAQEKKSEEISIYQEENRYDIPKFADVIFTPFDLTYDKREIQKKLFLSLQSISEMQDLMGAFAEVNGKLLELLDKLDFASEYDIAYEEDFDFSAVLKNYSVHIREPEGRFADKAIQYIVNMKKLLNKNVFIFVNCEAYISEGDYAHFAKCAQHYELYILFLNSRQVSCPDRVNECIIDRDLCEIH